MGILARILARITTGNLGKNHGKNCFGYLGKNLGKIYYGYVGKNLGNFTLGILARILARITTGNLGKIYYRLTLTLTSHLGQNVGLREG